MISIVIPAKNEAANLPVLLDEIEAAMSDRSFEIIVVDDGSSDDTGQVLAEQRARRNCSLRHIRHDHSAGKSIALRSGFLAARGDFLVTIDADGQNNPVYIIPLVERLQDAGADVALASGRRVGRKHTFMKNVASRLANWVRRSLLRDDTPDTACGLKAGRADVLKRLPYFEGAHRFLPALVKQEGFRTVHIEIEDRPRLHGTSHYGILDRGVRGAMDLIGVAWLQRRRKNLPIAREISDD